MGMELPKYKESLESPEKLSKKLITSKVNAKKTEGAHKVSQLEMEIAANEADQIKICASDDMSFDKLIGLRDNHQLLERKKEHVKDITKQMF